MRPSCRFTSPVVAAPGAWYHSRAYQNASRHRHLRADYAAIIVEGAQPPAAATPISGIDSPWDHARSIPRYDNLLPVGESDGSVRRHQDIRARRRKRELFGG